MATKFDPKNHYGGFVRALAREAGCNLIDIEVWDNVDTHVVRVCATIVKPDLSRQLFLFDALPWDGSILSQLLSDEEAGVRARFKMEFSE